MIDIIRRKDGRLWDSSSVVHNGNLLCDILWPVGSIYLSMVSTNPKNFFGGTWKQISQGRVLVGIDTSQSEFNAVGKMAGEKTHKLTISEMPEHNHDFVANNYNTSGWASYPHFTGGYDEQKKANDVGFNPILMNGGDQAHNNLQPYLVCYIWQRTS